ncbi:MAG: hypothetical protein QXG10_00085 [Candidatus Hadarchaeales archaeon]
MPDIKVLCIGRETKVVGSGLYRKVLRCGRVAVKVHMSKTGRADEMLERARRIDDKNRELRREVDFLPEYYGAVITGVRIGDRTFSAVVTFHEYVEPVRLYSLRVIRDVFELVARAGDAGYILDMKPSNFGMKGKQILYLDEYGLGKGPVPPDVMEDLAEMFRDFIKGIRLGKTRK